MNNPGTPLAMSATDESAAADRGTRWRVAAAVAAFTGVLAIIRYVHDPALSSDLDHLWFASRVMLQGGNPYDAVGPGKAFEWPWPVLYPLPGLLLVAPLTVLPVALARVVMSVASGAALGFAMGSRWRVQWPLLVSASYFLATMRNQWSPLILAAFWLPWLALIVIVKPNVGILPLLTQSRRLLFRTVLAAVVLLLLSVVIRPTWPREWLALASVAPNKEVPLFQPFGVLLLATLPLLTTAEGRVLLGASLIPQTPSVYDTLPLFALCRTTREALILATLSHVLQWLVIARGPYASYEASYASLAQLNVLTILLPAMLMLLERRFQLASRAGVALSPAAWRGIELTLTAACVFSLLLQLKLLLLW
ncbi:MAG: hypothetical protein U0163_05950 [Gemmatimonadaceae bacterium]